MSKQKITKKEIIDIVKLLTNNFTDILSREECTKYKFLNLGNNGIGSRWCKKIFNFAFIYSTGKTKIYSEKLNEEICEVKLDRFLRQKINNKGIIGIYIFSVRNQKESNRPIKKSILNIIKKKNCVHCGSSSDIICDHKNDIYNDQKVLNTKTQILDDFQPLCNHCNLLKRQIFKDETKNKKLYSAKNLTKYQMFPFEFPWEKKTFNINDIDCKKDTYWYDPVEFNRKLMIFMMYTIPINNYIKNSIKLVI